MRWEGKFILIKLTLVIGGLLLTFITIIDKVKAASATLSFSPSSISTEPNKTFSVNLTVNADTAINSASGTINFNSQYLSALSVSKSNSAFSLWTQEPIISSSNISFGGGLPNPGLMGSGRILSITFKAKAIGTTTVSIAGAKVLANDGKGTNILSSSGSLRVTINEVLSGVTITSASHPDQNRWYREKNLKLSWNKPANIKNFRYIFSNQNSQILKSAATNETAFLYEDLEEGIYTFKLIAIYNSGEKESSYKIKIDLNPPEFFEVKIAQQNSTDAFPVLSFKANDALSGIDYYLIILDGKEIGKTNENSFKSTKIRPGNHEIIVRAFDKAGNSTDSKAQITVQGFNGPIITDHPRFASVLQPIILKGKALYAAKIQLFIDGTPQGEPFIVRESLTDEQKIKINPATLKDEDQVEWIYTYNGFLKPGIHSFYAIQIKPDETESNPSNTVKVRILWTSVNVGGIIIPLAFIIIILVVLIALLLPLIIILWRKNRRHISSIVQKLLGLRKDIDQNIATLQKNIEKGIDNYLDKPKAMKSQISSELGELKHQFDQSIDQAIEQTKKEEK